MPLDIAQVPIQPIPGLDGGLGSGSADQLLQQQIAAVKSPAQVAVEGETMDQIAQNQQTRQLQMAQALAAEKIRRNTMALVPPGTNQFQMGLLETYQKKTGLMPPINAQTQQIDFKKLNEELVRLADQELAMQVIDKAGAPLRGGAGMISADEQVKAQNELVELQKLESNLQRAQTIVEQNPESLGPLRGSTAGQAAAWLGAVFGKEATYNNQRELEMFVNRQILDGAQKMKGNLSDRDVKFLVKGAPKLSDTPEVWKRYFAMLSAALSESRKNAQMRASGQLTAPIGDKFAPAGWTPPDSASGAEVLSDGTPTVQEAGSAPAATGVVTENAVRFDDAQLSAVPTVLKSNKSPALFADIGGKRVRITPAEAARIQTLKAAAPAAAPGSFVFTPPPANAVKQAVTAAPVASVPVTPYTREAFDQARAAALESAR